MTVIVDLTAVVAGTGRARLLDLVEGRSTATFAGWLAARIPTFRKQIEVVAMDDSRAALRTMSGTGGRDATSLAQASVVAGERALLRELRGTPGR